MSGLVLAPVPTARSLAVAHAEEEAEVMALMLSGNQLLNESGIGRIFPAVRWTPVDRQGGRDPSWVVVHDEADPTYHLLVRRNGRIPTAHARYPQYRHTIKVAVRARIRLPWRRWVGKGPNITRPEHLAAQLEDLT